MAISRQTYRVWYEDETFVDVISDQRDVAAFERAAGVGVKKAHETMTVVMIRHIAYQALRRNGLIPVSMKPEAWDKTVIEVEPLKDENAVDPTNEEDSSTGASASQSTAE